MTQNTPNFKFPYLYGNQAQKELLINESLANIDILLTHTIVSRKYSSPPPEFKENALYLVAANGFGVWRDKSNYLAFYSNGWRFITAIEGWMGFILDEACLLVFYNQSWNNLIKLGSL